MTQGSCSDPEGTVGAFLCRAGQHLRAAAIENPRLEARLLLGHALGTEPSRLIGESRRSVPPEAAKRFAELLRRRLEHAPIAHLIGTREFWSMPFAVSADTLIPRPDTETLVEAALAALPDRRSVRRVLDLGTGTGCLLLAALSEYPDAFGVGVDRVAGAAALARRNAAALGLGERARFVVGHWAAPLAGRFDLVLCNPPYIESAVVPELMPEVAQHEPASALDGGMDGLDCYRAVCAALPDLLAPVGVAVLELGLGQRSAVQAIARDQGLATRGCHADLGGIERALVLGAGSPSER